jgi:hypothetical protein
VTHPNHPNHEAAPPPSNGPSGDLSRTGRKGNPEALVRAAAKRAELRAAGVTPERLDPIEKARRNPTSLRLAINAKCFDCEGGNSDPNVQRRIGTCASRECPLWTVRPYQELAAGETRSRRDLQTGVT